MIWKLCRVVLVVGLTGWCCGQEGEEPRARAEAALPRLVTAQTKADAAEMKRLMKPGRSLFVDDFESEASFGKYFEIGGRKEGRVGITKEKDEVREGVGALKLSGADEEGRASDASVKLWLGDEGHEVLHMRYWMRYAPDYDQGHLHHSGGGLSAVAGRNKWTGMGSAGKQPAGDDHFNSRVEGWRDWGRYEPPGYLFCYTYWMEMKRDRDGNFWGNMLGPEEKHRHVPVRGRWHAVELRIACNHPDKRDGELAVWLDGELYLHYKDIRWRKSKDVLLKRASLSLYVHRSTRSNSVFFDDLEVATGYVGLGPPSAPARDGTEARPGQEGKEAGRER